MRKLQTREIVVASHNAGKVAEINDLIAPFGFSPLARLHAVRILQLGAFHLAQKAVRFAFSLGPLSR